MDGIPSPVLLLLLCFDWLLFKDKEDVVAGSCLFNEDEAQRSWTIFPSALRFLHDEISSPFFLLNFEQKIFGNSTSGSDAAVPCVALHQTGKILHRDSLC